MAFVILIIAICSVRFFLSDDHLFFLVGCLGMVTAGVYVDRYERLKRANIYLKNQLFLIENGPAEILNGEWDYYLSYTINERRVFEFFEDVISRNEAFESRKEAYGEVTSGSRRSSDFI